MSDRETLKRASKIRRLPPSEVPPPPFWGGRILKKIPVEKVLPFLNKKVLICSRWQLKEKIKLPANSRLIPEALLSSFLEEADDNDLLQFQAAYGYFPAWSQENKLLVFRSEEDSSPLVFNFPGLRSFPAISLADFFLPGSGGQKDVVAFSLVTTGQRLDKFIKEKWGKGKYADYFLWHGFGAELTEALVEYVHFRIRQELGLNEKKVPDYAACLRRKYRGRRLSPGYPAFPQLEDQKKILELLRSEEIGVSLTETFQLVPELSTTAIILHHPDASRYF
ncbi:MAG: vitamin B12 dependent-methionine synthase activation domain-containing protein [Acidobacteriota bacterium]|nr:vitamin B12 dependent-methionine synthase activation domain-containing protein [Acidobacteriota bacterium]